MPKNYQGITADISQVLGEFRSSMPEVMQGFSQIATGATKDGALDKTTKELIALALGIASHCDGCIGFHTKALVKLGVSEAAFTEMLGMAVYMGGGPSLMYAAEAMQAFKEFSEQ